jgi:hypothetical protein
MNALEIIGLLTCVAMVGVSLMWIATYTTRPNGKVVQKRRAKIVKWEDKQICKNCGRLKSQHGTEAELCPTKFSYYEAEAKS